MDEKRGGGVRKRGSGKEEWEWEKKWMKIGGVRKKTHHLVGVVLLDIKTII